MAEDYGFNLSVGGDIMAQLAKINSQLGTVSQKSNDTANQVKSGFEGIGNAAIKMGEIIAAAFSIEKIIDFGKELLNITAEFQGFENVIKYSSVNAKDAGDNLDYVKDAVNRLHLPIKEAYQAFSEMQAGFYGTAIEGKKLRDVFEGVSEAATVLNLSPDRFSRVTFALKEIGELGTVQARQMRMLGLALPGAMNIAAQSMHMSQRQFHKAMKEGEIDSGSFLSIFSESLKKNFKGGLANASHSLIAEMNDAQNSYIDLQIKMGETLTPVFTKILGTFSTAALNGISIWEKLTSKINFNKVITNAENGIKSLTDYLKPIFAAFLNFEKTVGNGIMKVISSLMQFAPQIQWLFDNIQKGIVNIYNASVPVFTFIFKALAGLIDVLHTIYVFLDKIGAIWVIGKIFEFIWFLIQKIAGAIAWVYDHTLKPLFEKLGEWYQKLKDILGIKSAIDVQAKITQAITGGNIPNKKKKKDDKELDIYAGRGNGMFNDTNGNNPLKNGAINTSNLSGASGGLGQAKVITINFKDAFQKIYTSDNNRLPEKGQDAISKMIQAVNNIAYNENQTQ
jgi:tape measure domain-containing protein